MEEYSMTYEEKKAWLNRYRKAEKLYSRLSDRLAEAQTAARHITVNVSAAPGGCNDGQSLPRAVEREEEAERRVYAQRAVCDALFDEIENVIAQLEENREYVVLHKYCLNCLTWEQIAVDMNFSLRNIFVLRRKAISHLKL